MMHEFLEDLDTLEKMVTASFGRIKNNDVEKLVFLEEQHPWQSNQLGHRIYIVPVEDKIRTIQLTFPVPDVLHQYKISVWDVCNNYILFVCITR